MFQKPVTVRNTSAFEHLAARLNLNTQAKKAEDDEDKKKDAKADDEGDDSKAKKAKNEDDERGDDDDDKKSKAADEGDDDEGDDPKKSKKKSKAKKAEDDKDDDDKKEARAAERKRIADIILSPEANASSACYLAAVRLALKSNMTADEVLAILELNSVSVQAPAPKDNSRREALEQRMSKSPKPDIGADGDGGSGSDNLTFAQKVILAGKRRRGEI